MNNPLDLSSADIEIKDIPLAHFIRSENKVYSVENRVMYCLILIKKGSLTYLDSKEKATASEGNILLISKGETYTILYNEGLKDSCTEFYIVEFELADKDLSFLKRVNKVNYPETYEKLYIQLERYNNFFHIAQGGYKMKSKALLYELIYNIFKENYKANLSHLEANLEKAKNYIDANIKEKITIDMLAEYAGYSTSYFKKKFREFYKISPGKYLMDVRINKAKVMLVSKAYTIAEITNECGFSSESYFSHAFKNAVGKSPKNY